RNQGRPGAVGGPAAFRTAVGNLPAHGDYDLFDAGDILCLDADLESAQEALATSVSFLLNKGYHPFLVGGGHEIAFAHFKGIKQHLTRTNHRAKVGVINFDSHLDIRATEEGKGTSGTSFYQIKEWCDKRNEFYSYLPIGIQKSANTKQLFERARSWNIPYILASDLALENTHVEVRKFMDKVEHIYLTICLDVFAAGLVSGVSAPTPLGILPQGIFLMMLNDIVSSGKLISWDIAELNPQFDFQGQTAKLAGILCAEILEKITPS
ncbi:MAG: formimidoylglutamase, partial [Saprospiraceae bacterium]|nr:formimidoylglutamase [Saprospiraceae bacterium]